MLIGANLTPKGLINGQHCLFVSLNYYRKYHEWSPNITTGLWDIELILKVLNIKKNKIVGVISQYHWLLDGKETTSPYYETKYHSSGQTIKIVKGVLVIN